MAAAIDLFEDTHWLLEQWAIWAWAHKLGGYPTITPFRRLKGGGIREPKIDDRVGGIVDAAIADLKEVQRDAGRAVKHYYLSGCNMTHVMRKLGGERPLRRRDANDLVNIGVSWIDATLDMGRYG